MRFDGTATATATATVYKTGESRRPALMWLGPSASMDITNILNRKGSAAAAAMAAAVSASNADPHLHQQLTHVATRSPSESGSERGHSAYGPDSSSHYSSRTAHTLHAMANLHSDLRYSSPTSMHAPLPHFPPGMMPTGTPFESAMVPNEHLESPAPPLPSPTAKAFPCTSCGKGFARRSDLARHGE